MNRINIMKKYLSVPAMLLSFAMVLSPLAVLNAADIGAKPNVIGILVDDAGYSDTNLSIIHKPETIYPPRKLRVLPL